MATTPARKIFPWKNVPPWSPLYHKLQLHSTTSLHNPAADTLHAGSDSRGSTEPESSPNKVRVLAVELSKKTDPTDSIVNANANDSEEAPLETTESSEQPLAAVTTLVSTMVVDISKLTTVKILDKRSNASRVEYECELKPLWLAADLVEKARMGRVCIRGYENGTCMSGTPPKAESGKAKIFTNVSYFERGQSFNLCFGPVHVFILSSYTIQQIKPNFWVSFPFSRQNSPQALPRGSQLAFDDGARENDREA